MSSRWLAILAAFSVICLVNIDYVLSGKRPLMTAAASTLVLATTWFCAAWACSRVVRWNSP